MIFAVDFDGTIVKHRYPEIGPPAPNAIHVLKKIQQNGHQIILHTMRSGKRLEEAVAYVKSSGIELYGVNENPEQKTWTDSPKPYAHIYIDDSALGCPLQLDDEGPYVDWEKIDSFMEHLIKHGRRNL